MKRAAIAAALLMGVCANAGAQPSPLAGSLPASALDDFPHVQISNGLIIAQVYPPGDKELYKGTRFDHAGVVEHITYKGQDYTQYWFNRFVTDPRDEGKYSGGTQHSCCAVSGPVEEFAPVGFDEAGIGGRFLKLGVGILRRDTEKYNQFPTYPILNAGKRIFTATKTGARFTQDLQDKESGYGYRYVKSVQLAPSKPHLTIAHVLTNTGSKSMVTTVYNHNFLTLSPGNEHVVIAAPFAMTAGQPLQPELARLEGTTIRYVAPIPPGEAVQSPITGYGATAADYDFTITNTVTGFGQRLRADQPVASINFWSMQPVLGWEPYIAISLKPGETKRWTNSYDFFGPNN
ncbi:MAG TPA: hypothetical protein VNN98_04725 [Rhizomicrobium sp.]|nr:hypothetical protein [Rhizomicrobium sp.]